MENLIGKFFVIYRKSRANIYKIIAFDEEVNRYIVRNKDEVFLFYEAFSKEELKKGFFDKDEYIKNIDERIEKRKIKYNEFLPIIDRLNKEWLFVHNFKGICEGLKNIQSIEKMLSYYDKSYDKNSNLYKRIVSNYNKEINAYKKGIRRNKKVLYRICSEEEYNYVLKICSATAIDDIFEIKCDLKNLENEKRVMIEAFSEINK